MSRVKLPMLLVPPFRSSVLHLAAPAACGTSEIELLPPSGIS
jgi:hypothetical protein